MNTHQMHAHKPLNYILIFSFGLLIGYFSTQWTYFSIEKDVNLIEVIGIIVNILLVYFISRVLEKRKTEDRIEKDIVIDKLKSIDLISTKISIVDNKFNFSKANSIFKELSTEVSALKRTFDYMKVTIDESKLFELKKQCLDFKKIITSQVVSNNELQFEDITINRAIITGRKLRELVFELIIDCNRL